MSVTVATRNENEPFGLTDSQQAYLLGRTGFHELDVTTNRYAEVDLADLDVARLAAALDRVVARHDMLRTVLLPDGRQRVLESVPPYHIIVTDLRDLPEPARERRLAWAREWLSTQPMPTERWPLFDVRVHRLGERRGRLHVAVDPLVLDGGSLGLLLAELLTSYVDGELAWPAPGMSFRDYVSEVDELESGPAFERARDYWLGRLDELPGAPELPLAVAPGQLELPRCVRRGFQLDAGRWASLRRRAAAAGLTPSTVLCAAYAEVLGCWSASPRFTVNVTVPGRLPVHPRVGQVLGDFTSPIPLACDPGAGSSFAERASALRSRLRTDVEHRLFSGVRVVRELGYAGGPARASLPVGFTSLLGDANLAAAARIGDLVHIAARTPQAYLDLQVFELAGVLHLDWDAVDGLFPPGLLDAMVAAHERLVHRLADEDSVWDRDRLDLVPPADLAARERVNATAGPQPDTLLHESFEWAIPARAGEPAVIAGDRVLSYAELDDRATRVGHRLRAAGVRPNDLVAVVMDKGWEQVVATVGILRSGGAYLPVDPGLPAKRVAQLLADGEVTVALTQTAADGRVAWPDGILRLAVDDDTAWAPASTERLTRAQTLDDLAYVIFTSGSTGRPKGVMINHRGAANTIGDINRRFRVGPGDRLLSLSSLSFDLAVYDVFGTLAAGGTIVLPDPGRERDHEHWAELMARHRVTVWNSVPALLHLLVGYAEGRPQPWGEHLRLALLSGDWIPVPLPDRLRAVAGPVEIVSLGGATEASIWSIAYPIGDVDPDWASVPYGTPLTNQTFHVLDHELRPRPTWVAGELFIGGTGVAMGYRGDPDRTAASFITHPVTGERLYRTGDLGRYLPDGTIEFLGRADTQVKIHGYRIELGEIEATLATHPRVRDAVVTATSNQLHAYLVPAAGEPAPDSAEVAAFAADALPEYMVPSRYALIDELPLSGNGKVDRSALPSLTGTATERDIVPPESAMEMLFLDIWRDVLGLDVIGVTERFAELGGDSLLGFQVVARASAAGLRVTPQDFFAHPTIRQLAAVAVEAGDRDGDGDGAGPVPLSPMQRGFLAQDVDDPSHWNYAFLFELGARLEPDVLRRAASEVIGHHAGLRTGLVRPDGQWRAFIAGADVARSLAFETIDLAGTPPGRRRAVIEGVAADRQRGFDLASPPLLWIVYFDCGGSERPRLLVLGHWLIWDNYSTRIVFDDLITAYRQLVAGGPVLLPPVPTSLRSWLTRLERHADSADIEGELGYWAAAGTAGARIPTDFDGENSLDSARTVVTALDRDRTAGLLAYAADTETSVADVLLAALASAIASWNGEDRIVVDVDGHGREPLFADVDLSRTVGRLSVRYPVAIDLSGCHDPSGILGTVAGRRASVPRGGVGYGLLSLVSGKLAPAAAEVCFNYIGRMDGMVRDELLAPAAENPGPPHSASGTRGHVLDVLSAVVDSELVVGIGFSANLHARTTMDALGEAIMAQVAGLVPVRYERRAATPRSPAARRSPSSIMRSWMDGGSGDDG